MMRSLLWFAILGIVALPANGSEQESKTRPEKEKITKATYKVTGLH
jgi:hypothetical protein